MEIESANERLRASGLPDGILFACLEITGWLGELAKEEAVFVTLADVNRVVGDNVGEDHMLAALSVLSASEYAILSVHGYLDDYEEGPILLDDDAFRAMLSEGVLAHPETGEIVDHPEEHVHLYYRVKNEALG